MPFNIKFYVVIVLLIIFIATSCSKDIKEIRISESIGFYTAGCVRNSEKLKETGDGYQVIRLSRNRFYGHPDLIEFIKYLGQKSKTSLNSTLLIGDLSQQSGGPLPSDHNSHQTGLDADILYLNHNNGNNTLLTILQREEIEPISVLNPDKTKINKDIWSDTNSTLLKFAADYKKVQRIFVNPLIKKKLCEDHKGEIWLSKIRPWYEHDGHFHIRLRCPEESFLCEKQKHVEVGSGCGEDLEQWFTGNLNTDKSKIRQIPKECENIIQK